MTTNTIAQTAEFTDVYTFFFSAVLLFFHFLVVGAMRVKYAEAEASERF